MLNILLCILKNTFKWGGDRLFLERQKKYRTRKYACSFTKINLRSIFFGGKEKKNKTFFCPSITVFFLKISYLGLIMGSITETTAEI